MCCFKRKEKKKEVPQYMPDDIVLFKEEKESFSSLGTWRRDEVEFLGKIIDVVGLDDGSGMNFTYCIAYQRFGEYHSIWKKEYHIIGKSSFLIEHTKKNLNEVIKRTSDLTNCKPGVGV